MIDGLYAAPHGAKASYPTTETTIGQFAPHGDIARAETPLEQIGSLIGLQHSLVSEIEHMAQRITAHMLGVDLNRDSRAGTGAAPQPPGVFGALSASLQQSNESLRSIRGHLSNFCDQANVSL